MQPEFKRPLPVIFCEGMIRVAAWLVPSGQRDGWQQEWSAEIWHRWQFLLHAGEWTASEQARLVRNCCGAFPDAAWHLGAQESVQLRVREAARSPWTCLAGLALAYLLLAVITGIP